MDHPSLKKENPRRQVLIYWVAHSFPQYQDVLSNPFKLRQYLRSRGPPMIMNYAFVKTFTNGVEDTWNITACNQFFMSSLNHN